MKLVTYTYQNKMDAGIYHEGKIWPFASISKELPETILDLVKAGEEKMNLASSFNTQLINGSLNITHLNEADVKLEAPIPQPTSCRDGYAFRQHVAAARRNRGVPMIPEFDQYPIFYFTNHNAIQGPGEILCMPDHFQKLDFELEVAIVVGKKGRNFTAAEADAYIAGYTIMNDMSARTLQMEEMLLNLGPAKGKDFSTVIGPYMVTPDELASYKTSAKPGHVGNSYALEMTCKVNGIEVSRGSVADMDWTFAEIIERCAYGVDVFAGDVIGSGTVGTGCFLELNGTGLLNDPNYAVQWLKANDVVEMEITGLGKLSNTMRAVDSDFSILALKK